MTRASCAQTTTDLLRRCLAAFVMILIGTALYSTAEAGAAPSAAVQLDVERIGPRDVEEQTAKAIVRDYGAAWVSLIKALEQNQPEQLGDVWVGFAKQKFVDAIDQQKRSGVRVRFSDRSHDLKGVFYSPEGSALELHDTAQLQRQVLDGDTVIASQNMTVHYVVVMTPTADHWQVRMLQSVPGF